MDKPGIQYAVEAGNIGCRRHSLERMLERGISRSQVQQTIVEGDIIEEYPEDMPFPSALFLGWFGQQPLHVVAAYDKEHRRLHIITAYVPDLGHFESDFITRR